MNIQKMLQQAQKAQADLQKSLAELEIEGSAGGGIVKVKLSGMKELRGVTIDGQAVAGEDAGLIADLVMAAWEDANRQLEERTRELLGRMGLPAGLSGMF